MKKALVLSSGGVDSTTCIGVAVQLYGKENVSTVSVYYGQRHSKELECAKKVAEYYDVNHYVIDLSQVMKFSNCPLLSHSDLEIPQGSYSEQINKDINGMVETYVPFRNGLLLASVATIAMSIYPEDNTEIFLGAHADDAAGNAYADCSEDFVQAMDKAIQIGTYGKVRLNTPLVNLNKAQVVNRGLNLKVPYELTWSCYNGKDKPCGVCGTCIDRQKAFELNGVIDPLLC